MLEEIDEQTIIAFKNGDEESFNRIFNFYKNKIYFMALEFFQDKHIAEDIVQETFLEVYKSIHNIQDVKAFKAWLYKISYHVSLNKIRNKKLPIVENTEEFTIEDYGEIDASKLTAYEKQEITNGIMEAIEKLNLNLKVVCLLFFKEGFSTKEIADITGISENAVHKRIKRIRYYLQEELKKQGITPKKLYGTVLSPATLLIAFEYMQAQAGATTITSSVIIGGSDAVISSHGTLLVKGLLGTAVIGTTIVGGIYLMREKPKEEIPPPVKIDTCKIEDIKYDKGYRNQNLAIQVETNNKEYDYITINDVKTKRIKVNGTYKVALVKDEKVIDKRTITIKNIDKESPKLVSVQKNGAIHVIYYQDNLSGIDDTNIQFYVNGKQSTQYSYDSQNQAILVSTKENEKYYIVVSDKAGNKMETYSY